MDDIQEFNFKDLFFYFKYIDFKDLNIKVVEKCIDFIFEVYVEDFDKFYFFVSCFGWNDDVKVCKVNVVINQYCIKVVKLFIIFQYNVSNF